MMSVACNSSDFSGNTGQAQTATKPTPAPTPVHYQTPQTQQQPATQPLPQVVVNQSQSTPAPVNNPLADLMNNILKPNTDQSSAQPNPNTIIFGGQKVFHIGDGQMDGSSCMLGISLYAVAGTRYYFQFQVTQAATDASISINQVCGVDYSDSNFLSLVTNGGQVLQQQVIPVGSTTLQLSATGLSPGWYYVLVESRTGSKDPKANPNDADDYIVGQVAINANHPIIPGQVGTN